MIARWTVAGKIQAAGFSCLELSVLNLQNLYPDAKLYICYNGLNSTQFNRLRHLPANLINQEYEEYVGEKPIGVAWKLRPPRLAITEHELFIDNDLILQNRIEEIDGWLHTSGTLMLEGQGRNYGQFERHIPAQYRLNSGLFGIPPGFDLASYVALWGKWENNCDNESKTWSEQGLIASALTHSTRHIMIPKTTITNCEFELIPSSGMHFISLNRTQFHRPFAEYQFGLIHNLL